MLEDADAALLIGDSALRIEPESLPYETLDLGAEWFSLTGLPMVFAAWAGTFAARPDEAQQQSCSGPTNSALAHLDEIVDSEFERRGVTRELAHRYVAGFIRYPLGSAEQRGLDAFLSLAGPFWKDIDRQPDLVTS